jgi:hypothetical protein
MYLIKKRSSAKTLADFELDDASIAQIVADAHVARQALSPFAPRNAGGLTFYFEVITGLRRCLVTRGSGWKAKTLNGLEVVEHRERKLRIGYVMADDGTGVEGRKLKSARRRGRASLSAVAQNMQLCLGFPPQYLSGNMSPSTSSEVAMESWFLAVFHGTDGYRIELGLPIRCEDGHFAGWAQRIPISDVGFDSEPKFDEPTVATPQAKPRARKKKSKDVVAPRTGTGTGE